MAKKGYSGKCLTLLLIFTLVIGGCNAKKGGGQDPFFGKWHTLAETATGHTPLPKKRASALVEELLKEAGDTEKGKAPEAPKILPTQPISLKMRQADVKAVLRSLARSVERNILVKNDIKGEITVDFRDVPWDQAFNSILKSQGLIYLWEGDIIRVLTLEDQELELKRKTQEQGIQRVAPLLTVVVPIDYARPKDLKDNLESFLTKTKEDKPRGSVRVDEHSNSLIISAIRDDLLKMMPIIEKIDKPTPQIQIKANIVETTKEIARELGIQWGGMYQTTSTRTGGNIYVTPGGTTMSGAGIIDPLTGNYTPSYGLPGLSNQGFGVNFPPSNGAVTAAEGLGTLGLLIGTLGGNILEIQLNALQKDSKLNILSSPSIITRDNQMAYTENGERIPYVTNQSSGGTVTQTTEFQDVVLRLEITPHVIDDKTLSMKILVKKDEVDPYRNVQGNPFIIKKTTATNLICRDGETIVISGLSKQRISRGDTGVPGVKDVPLLGYLFKNDSRADKMEEVLIFITPRILPPYRDMAALAAPPPEGAGGSGPGVETGPEKRPPPAAPPAGDGGREAPARNDAPVRAAPMTMPKAAATPQD
ncbi:MAG: type IV pilus secretin PilQ [Pseudomonadota bacterium]|nr:type IV pilus secretin PilQ [Pseudomonadota bacterium]